MPSVKIKDSPSEALIAEAKQEAVITAANGKRIAMRKPGIISQFDLVHDLGDSASNATYMNMVIPLTWVTAIDDEPVNQIKSRLQINALIQRLGDQGVSAVMKHIRDFYEQQAAAEEVAALKNS